jgi:von Willebrand factor type A domain
LSRARAAAFLVAFALALLAAIGTPGGGAREVVYVLDVSRSHGPGADLLASRLEDWHARSPWADLVPRTILAGATAIREGDGPPPSTEGSRVDLGLELARRTLGAARDVVVLSDGRFDHAAAAEQVRALAEAGARVAFAGPLARAAEDFRLVPRGVAPVEGGKARVRVAIAGVNREPRRVALTVTGDETAFPLAQVVVAPGATEEWEAWVPVAPGTRWLTVRIDAGDRDASAANDELAVPVVRDEPRAIIVGAHSGLQRPVIARALQESSWTCDLIDELDRLDLRELAQADLLVLVDQSIGEGSAAAVRAIEEALTRRGLGLWVVGGPNAFGGGYAASRIDDLLPLSSRRSDSRTITVMLDTSGSMEKDGRLERAIEAVTQLASSLSPEDRIQVLPFTQEPAAPIPDEPVSPTDFLSRGIPALRKLSPFGGTRILPVVDAALARPRAKDQKTLFIVVSDFRDDSATIEGLEARREKMNAASIECFAFLFEESRHTQPDRTVAEQNFERAASLVTVTVIRVENMTPRVLLEAVESESFHWEGTSTVLPDGRPGPAVLWWNAVREGQGALVEVKTREGKPLMATAFRGAGRSAAWAAWPALATLDEEAARIRDWAGKTARPAEWRRITARREADAVTVSMPPASVPEGPLTLRGGAGLRERTPGVFEVPAAGGGGESLEILEAGRPFATVALPPAGDPEYAFPAGLPAGEAGAPLGRGGRLRAPWAALSAVAWAAGLLLRRRG